MNNNNFKINENIIELNNEKNNLKQEKNETDIESNLLLSNLESISKNSIKDISKNINEDVPTLPVIPLNIKKDIFNQEVCTFCFKSMTSFKYICTICENCNLCEKCEEIHLHPCFKYKTQFLSNITDTYKYIDRNYNYHIPIDSKKMTKLIRKEYNLKIVPMTDLRF